MQVKGVPFTNKFYVDKTPSLEAGYICLDENDGCTVRGCKRDKVVDGADSTIRKGRQEAMKESGQLMNLNQDRC